MTSSGVFNNSRPFNASEKTLSINAVVDKKYIIRINPSSLPSDFPNRVTRYSTMVFFGKRFPKIFMITAKIVANMPAISVDNSASS